MTTKRAVAARAILALTFVLPCLLPCSRAHAGGLYFFDRGARALGRGGAFIAGVDDPSALWYNPAGLVESKRQLVADAVMPILVSDFERENPDGSYSEKMRAKPTMIPIPTLAFSHDFGFKDLVFGAGIIAPPVVLMNYEQSVTPALLPSPTRYSILELRGTVLANLAGGVGWKASDWLYLGADVHAAFGYFRAKAALSACDGVICSMPEAKDFDAYATVKTIPTYGFTGVLGAIADFDLLRFGFSIMLPYTLRGHGKVDVQMPTNAIFAEAVQEGDEAKLSVKFPTILRFGSELRLVKWLRLEGSVVWEQWSRQQTIDIDTGGDVTLANVTGLGDYQVGNIQLPRKMKNVWSIRGGFEATFPKRWIGNWDFGLRGGMAYESGAFDEKNISPLTIDTDKMILNGGLTVGLTKWLRFDGVFGFSFLSNIDSAYAENTIKQPQAIRPALLEFPTTIGAGHYTSTGYFLGGGFRALLDTTKSYTR